jgi:hypothetical protein
MSSGVWLAVLASAAITMEDTVLQPKTAESFAKYAAAVEARIDSELKPDGPFLTIDRQAQAATARAAMRRGEVVIDRPTARDQAGKEIQIEGGLINHWRGSVFVPKVSMDELLANLKEPGSDRHKQEDVLKSTVLSRDGDYQKVYLRLKRSKVITVIYDTEYDVHYRRISPARAASKSISTRVVEVEKAGTPQEYTLPEGNDHGYVWRMYSYWRYEQLADGVVIEVESLTLSRSLPPIIGAFMRPIITHIARETLERTLTSIRGRFAS